MVKRKLQRVTVTYEYTSGTSGVKRFLSPSEALWWLHSEGDHIKDYTLFYEK